MVNIVVEKNANKAKAQVNATTNLGPIRQQHDFWIWEWLEGTGSSVLQSIALFSACINEPLALICRAPRRDPRFCRLVVEVRQWIRRFCQRPVVVLDELARCPVLVFQHGSLVVEEPGVAFDDSFVVVQESDCCWIVRVVPARTSDTRVAILRQKLAGVHRRVPGCL